MNDFTRALDRARLDPDELWSIRVKQLIESMFVKQADRVDRYGLHASAILDSDGSFCYREQVLSLFYERNPGGFLPVNTLMIFAAGNAIHEKYYDLFRKNKIDIAIERTLSIDEYDLNFTIDALLNIDGEEIVCDVKSQNTRMFRQEKGHLSGEKQVNFYLWALSYLTGEPHRKGFVLVEDKNTQKIKVVPVKYSKEEVKPYINRLKQIQILKDEFCYTKKPPARICDRDTCKRASRCGMRDACFNVGTGRNRLKHGKRCL